ncbi:specificity protein transcription factor 3-like isoform X1 [Argopecten irradians]|uniref:specificity protein transcription factor 3-like isoform X1 n=1 Tax=Argopecten irradians TaxID=31199 RepID=UPI00371CB556
MASLQELLSIKEDFGSMIDRLQPWILSHFVIWLDLKIAEYKVYGYMMLNESHADGNTSYSGQSPELSPLARSTPPKLHRGGVNIIPKPFSQKNIQKSISRRHQVEQDGHIQNMNSLFLNSFSKQQGTERNPKYQQQRNETHISPGKSVVNSDVYGQRQLQTNIDQRSDMYLAYNQENVNPTQESRQHDTTALYKSQQFSTLISDTHSQIDKWNVGNNSQKFDSIENWSVGDKTEQSTKNLNDYDESQTLKNVTVIDLAGGSQSKQSHGMSEKEDAENGDQVNAELSMSQLPTKEDDVGQSNPNTDSTSQSFSQDESSCNPVFIKIESDGEENILQPEAIQGAVDQNFSSDISNFKSFYMDDGSSGSNSAAVVPVELVQHGNVPSMTLSQGLSAKKRRYVRTKPFSPTSSCVSRDPVSGKFVCTICNGKFQNRSSFFRHKSLHGEKRLQCFVCLKRFHRKEHVSMHMNRHGKNGELICPICQMVGRDAVEMEQHFFVVHKVRSMYTYRIHSDRLNLDVSFEGQNFTEDLENNIQISPNFNTEDS